MSQPQQQRSFRKNRGNKNQQPNQAQNNQSVQSAPPGQGTSRSARRRRNRLLRSFALDSTLEGSWLNASFLDSGATNQNRVVLKTNPRTVPSLVQGRRPPNVEFLEVGSDAGTRYVAAVLDPTNAPEGVRVVNDSFAIETSVHKYSMPFRFTANANGDFLVRFRPHAHWIDPMLTILNDATYNPDNGGQGAVAGATSLTKNDDIASNMVFRWRPVAASLQVTYVDRHDASSGRLFYGFNMGADGATSASLTTDQIDELPHSSQCTPDKTPEVLWLPIDANDTDFRTVANVNDVNANGSLLVQGVGMPANAKMRGLVTLHAEFIRSSTNKLSSVDTASSKMPGSSWTNILSNAIKSAPSYVASPASEANIFSQTLGSLQKIAVNQLQATAAKAIGGVLGSYLGGPFGAMGGSYLASKVV